jgi:hypothetical protein
LGVAVFICEGVRGVLAAEQEGSIPADGVRVYEFGYQ